MSTKSGLITKSPKPEISSKKNLRKQLPNLPPKSQGGTRSKVSKNEAKMMLNQAILLPHHMTSNRANSIQSGFKEIQNTNPLQTANVLEMQRHS